MTDKCTKIVTEFENEVLGPYRWSWSGDDAEKVFSELREKMRGIVVGNKLPQPQITDLRKEKAGCG